MNTIHTSTIHMHSILANYHIITPTLHVYIAWNKVAYLDLELRTTVKHFTINFLANYKQSSLDIMTKSLLPYLSIS